MPHSEWFHPCGRLLHTPPPPYLTNSCKLFGVYIVEEILGNTVQGRPKLVDCDRVMWLVACLHAPSLLVQ